MEGLARTLAVRCLVVVTALVLAACASTPIMVPDLAGTREQVRIEAPDGRLLSPAQSKALIDKLQAGAPQSTVLERHLAVEEAVAGNKLTAGNAVVLLQNGPSTYEAMFAAIWRECLGVEIPATWPRMTFEEADRRFGSDKPDTRFGLELEDATELTRSSAFGVFAGAGRVP